MIWYYVLLWFGLVVLAILNGLARENLYRRRLGELPAHQASTTSFILLIGLYVWIFSTVLPLESAGQAFLVGVIWLFMTIIFEFIFGHYVMKKPWQVLFTDYDIRKGRVWILILLWTLFSPLVFYAV